MIEVIPCYEDGFLDNKHTVITSTTAILISTSSSLNSDSTQGFWFFDTSCIPEDADITKVSLDGTIRFVSGNSDHAYFAWQDGSGESGDHLTPDNWDYPPSNDVSRMIDRVDLDNINPGHLTMVAWPQPGLPNTHHNVNTSGVTVIRAGCGSSGTPCRVVMSALEDKSRQPFTLTVEYE